MEAIVRSLRIAESSQRSELAESIVGASIPRRPFRSGLDVIHCLEEQT